MMFRSLFLSFSLLSFLAGDAAIAMEKESPDVTKVRKKRKDIKKEVEKTSSPQELVFADIWSDIEKFIVQYVLFTQCVENTSPVNLTLVCKKWGDIVKQYTQVNEPGWKALHGIIGSEIEAIYQAFCKGKLIYKPNPNSDEGMVVMPIANLANPLDGEFDLSGCSGQYSCLTTEEHKDKVETRVDRYSLREKLSINTGYRKGLRPENMFKFEIWFAPHFLIKKNLEESASHFKDIMISWNPLTAPVGTFFNNGGKGNLNYYDYAIELKLDDYNHVENNLRNIYDTEAMTYSLHLARPPMAESFYLVFE